MPPSDGEDIGDGSILDAAPIGRQLICSDAQSDAYRSIAAQPISKDTDPSSVFSKVSSMTWILGKVSIKVMHHNHKPTI